jgi:hypothetical protein
VVKIEGMFAIAIWERFKEMPRDPPFIVDKDQRQQCKIAEKTGFQDELNRLQKSGAESHQTIGTFPVIDTLSNSNASTIIINS